MCSGPVTSQGSARRSHTPSVEFRIGGRRLAVVQDLRFVRDWICLLERISRTPSEPLHSELIFLSRLRRLWKYSPPVLPPPGQNPRISYASFLGAQDPRISYASLVSFTAVSPLLSSLFFPPSFLLLFCSFPLFSPGLVNVAFNREGSNSELVVAATAAVVVPLMIFMEVQREGGVKTEEGGEGEPG